MFSMCKKKQKYIYISAASNHFHHYYIYGEFPACEMEKENLKRCFSYKFNRLEEDKVCLVCSLFSQFAILRSHHDATRMFIKKLSALWE